MHLPLALEDVGLQLMLEMVKSHISTRWQVQHEKQSKKNVLIINQGTMTVLRSNHRTGTSIFVPFK